VLFRDDKEGEPRFASAAWVDDLVEVNKATPMQVHLPARAVAVDWPSRMQSERLMERGKGGTDAWQMATYAAHTCSRIIVGRSPVFESGARSAGWR
jgi:hypothetical protein